MTAVTPLAGPVQSGTGSFPRTLRLKPAMSHIRGEPTAGLSYNPNMPVYWESAALKQELERVFEICHDCRLCFNLCPSFPAPFEAVDRYDGDVRRLTPGETDRVIDTCYL